MTCDDDFGGSGTAGDLAGRSTIDHACANGELELFITPFNFVYVKKE